MYLESTNGGAASTHGVTSQIKLPILATLSCRLSLQNSQASGLIQDQPKFAFHLKNELTSAYRCYDDAIKLRNTLMNMHYYRKPPICQKPVVYE